LAYLSLQVEQGASKERREARAIARAMAPSPRWPWQRIREKHSGP
jgi:hypothetical protein